MEGVFKEGWRILAHLHGPVRVFRRARVPPDACPAKLVPVARKDTIGKQILGVSATVE
jgi:hypothetical protein